MTLLASGSTSGAVPALVTDGVAFPYLADQAIIMLKSTAGSGTMTATPVLWGWSILNAEWYRIGALNGGTAIAEVVADTLNYTELVVGLRPFTRLAVELTVSGTNTAVKVTAHPIKAESSSR
jgi:hypothetical protein